MVNKEWCLGTLFCTSSGSKTTRLFATHGFPTQTMCSTSLPLIHKMARLFLLYHRSQVGQSLLALEASIFDNAYERLNG